MKLSVSSIITRSSVGLLAAVAAYFVVSAFVHAEAAPSITNQIQNASNAVVTTALVGSSVHDVVKVASTTNSALPQGTVDFAVYPNTTCSGSPSSTQNAVALVNGFATSTESSVTSAGLSYKVHYSGDNSNIAADSSCISVSATSNTAAISATLSTTTAVLAGSSVRASAALQNVTSGAGGSVAYTVYSNSSCTTPFQGAGVRTVTNGVSADSDNVTFSIPGNYYWQAVYSGDANNSAATSSCSNALVVQAIPSGKNSPTISTVLSSTSIQVGTSVTNAATISGATANATGTVTYKVFTNNTCTSLWANAGSQSVTNAAVPASAPVLFNAVGMYYWQAVYGGDQNNNAATSTCGNQTLIVSASGTTPPPSATTTNSISGQVFNDLNKNGVKDSGEQGLAGFKINLYNSANFNGGSYSPVYRTVVTDGNGNYAFNSLADGTYSVEQLKKKNWKQNSDDFASVAVSGGVGKSGLNFADVAKKNKGKDTKDDGKHKKDCSDAEDREHSWKSSTSTKWNSGSTTASSTPPGWFKSGKFHDKVEHFFGKNKGHSGKGSRH